MERVAIMTPAEALQTVRQEMETGLGLPKCRQCGCMASALDSLAAALPAAGGDAADLADALAASRPNMQPVRYACLGCAHCFPAVAQNAFDQAFPALSQAGADLSCDFRVRRQGWPPVAGQYVVLDTEAPVAVSTLGSVSLVAELAHRRPRGLAIVGKTETENIGLDKVIKNLITSPTIHTLILAGVDPGGHLPGQTLLALAQNGVDENRRVLGSPGRRPFLRNVSVSEIEAFRDRVQVVDMIGCQSPADISARIEALAAQPAEPGGCGACGADVPVPLAAAPRVVAAASGAAVQLDRGGYFVIMPPADTGVILVEHYAYDNTLLRVIEGATARAIYRTIIDNGWVTELSHAAYLGQELIRAEMSGQLGFEYVQDGA